MIENYSFGSITINGKTYNHDVIIFKGEISSWLRETSHNVYPEDISSLVAKGPKKIVFGTGEAGIMEVSGQTKNFLRDKGIEFIILKTGEASKKFNELQSQPGIAAALHLTC